MYNFGIFDAFIVKPTIMPDFARNLLHYIGLKLLGMIPAVFYFFHLVQSVPK